MACAVEDARIAPPAPALMAGRVGIVPATKRIADRVLITRGCSFCRKSRALVAFKSQAGARNVPSGRGGRALEDWLLNKTSPSDFAFRGTGRATVVSADTVLSFEFFRTGQIEVVVARPTTGRSGSDCGLSLENNRVMVLERLRLGVGSAIAVGSSTRTKSSSSAFFDDFGIHHNGPWTLTVSVSLVSMSHDIFLIATLNFFQFHR